MEDVERVKRRGTGLLLGRQLLGSRTAAKEHAHTAQREVKRTESETSFFSGGSKLGCFLL